MLFTRQLFLLKMVLSLPAQIHEQPMRGNFADAWSNERLEYARVMARLNTMMKHKTKKPAPKPVEQNPAQPAYVRSQFDRSGFAQPIQANLVQPSYSRSPFERNGYYRTLSELTDEGRFRRQNFAVSNTADTSDIGRGKKKKKNLEDLDYDYALQDLSDSAADDHNTMIHNSAGYQGRV
mgnify:CR=1 FL=1